VEGAPVPVPGAWAVIVVGHDRWWARCGEALVILEHVRVGREAGGRRLARPAGCGGPVHHSEGLPVEVLGALSGEQRDHPGQPLHGEGLPRVGVVAGWGPLGGTTSTACSDASLYPGGVTAATSFRHWSVQTFMRRFFSSRVNRSPPIFSLSPAKALLSAAPCPPSPLSSELPCPRSPPPRCPPCSPLRPPPPYSPPHSLSRCSRPPFPLPSTLSLVCCVLATPCTSCPPTAPWPCSPSALASAAPSAACSAPSPPGEAWPFCP